ncbi:hypothetical protein HDU96_008864 [Phlyctochytrium bullatum]|nr:hypothetical protein HDU96_008864 [Phlyctochytrium bullatum]
MLKSVLVIASLCASASLISSVTASPGGGTPTTTATATTLARASPPTSTPVIVQDSAFDTTSNTLVLSANMDSLAPSPNYNGYLFLFAGDTGALRTPLVLANKTQNRAGPVVVKNGVAVALYQTKVLGEIGSDCMVAAFNLTTRTPLWSVPIPRFDPTTETIANLLTTDASSNIYAAVSIGIPTPNDNVAYATRLLKLSPTGQLQWVSVLGNPPATPDAVATASSLAVSDSLGVIALAGEFGLAFVNATGGPATVAFATMPDGRKPLAIAYAGTNLLVSTYLSTYTVDASRRIVATAAAGGSFVVPVPGTPAEAFVVKTLAEAGVSTAWNLRVARVNGNTTVWSRDVDTGSTDIAIRVSATANAVYVAAQTGSSLRSSLIKVTAAGALSWIATTPNSNGAAAATVSDRGVWLTSYNGLSDLLAF